MTEQEYTPMGNGKQLLSLFGLWIGFTIIGVIISLAVVAGIYGMGMWNNILSMSNTSAPGFLNAFRLFIALGSSLIGFLAPALVFSYFVVQEPVEYIGMRNYTPAILILVAAAIMIFFLPTIDIASYFNQKMTLPPALHGIDQWIHDAEKAAAAQFKVLLDMKTPVDLIITLLIVALFPALSEEFFFRGCLQPIFKRITRDTHGAVWITAFIFSFIHFEFLGFVPRLLLGAVLGYLYQWSGTIWPSVTVHFVNNGFSVVGLYLYQHKYFTTDPDNGQPMFSQAWIYVVSFLLSVGLMYLFHKITIDKQLLADGEELD
jgi:membrane protease YdiL (CAAX protease family)